MGRERQRQGRHASVGGDAADAALNDLVAQFADPFSFVRELIQNSLDAGALSIEVAVRHVEGRVHIDVVDDGEGMDRATIEGYLLTLFRSTKEEDLTKIGKFGIGFVSLFAIEPEEVVVDTGRDGVWHRVTFDQSRAWTLRRMDDPFEGTTVSIRKKRTSQQAAAIGRQVREAAVRWCRHADAAIRVALPGERPEPIRAPFTLDGPVSVTHAEDGLEVVLAPHPGSHAPVTFTNHGLTLWEGVTDVVPGVRFIAKGRHLEHTLTRDDVKRDRHFAHVVRRIREVAGTRLRDAVVRGLAEAASAGDLARAAQIAASVHPGVDWRWPRDVALLPAVGRQPVPLGAVGGAWLLRWVGGTTQLLAGDPGEALVRAVAADGHLVVAATPAHGAHARWAAAVVGAELAWVRERFTWVEPTDPPAWLAGVVDVARGMLPRGMRLEPGRLHGSIAGRLAVAQAQASGVDEAVGDVVARGRFVCFDVEHPTVLALRGVPEGPAALLLLRAALAASGHRVAPDRAAFEARRE